MHRSVVSALVLSASLAVASRDAAANSCSLYQPQLARYVDDTLPLGCPLVAYIHPDVAASYPPDVERQGAPDLDVVASISTDAAELQVWYETIDTACVEHDYFAPVVFDRISIRLENVSVGDIVRFVPAWSTLQLVAAGPCPAAEPPEVYCQDGIQEYWACDDPNDPEDDPKDPDDGSGGGELRIDGGCSAGGGLGLAALALLLGVRRRATSRR